MKIVCAGDSLTRGQVSTDYVAILRRYVSGAVFVNAGVNLDLSSGLAARLDAVIAEAPDVVTVLIGTNNVRAALSDKDAERLRRRWKLVHLPTLASYREDLRAIAARLRRETRARIAFLSLPVIGEDIDAEPNRRAAEYSEVVRQVAIADGVGYLPLHEQMVALLSEARRTPATAFRPGVFLTATAAMQHFILRRSLDAISRSRGLQLTTDTLHLNSRGAAMVAALIAGFVRDAQATGAAS